MIGELREMGRGFQWGSYVVGGMKLGDWEGGCDRKKGV